ncbi:unnamed protein product, partial [Ectocarpus sp. 6 AP-2014]
AEVKPPNAGARTGWGAGRVNDSSGPNSSLKLGLRMREPEQPLNPHPATSLLQWGQWSRVPYSANITSDFTPLLRVSPPAEPATEAALSFDLPRRRTPLVHLPEPRCPPPPPPPPPLPLKEVFRCLRPLP